MNHDPSNNPETREIRISEGQLGNLHDLAMELFASNDPTNYFYQRKLVRPKINWLIVALNCLLPPVLAVSLYHLLVFLQIPGGIALAVCIALPILYLLLNLKRAIICAVKIYQRLAPDAVRKRCRFEPSCSQYMLLSLDKYGLRKGFAKGIDRLKRCNLNDGGFDDP